MTDSDDTLRTGRCNCGAVRFTTRGPLRAVVACHCSQCRRQTGLHYAATNVADGRLTVEGADAVTWYRASQEAGRGFCRHCGSALFWKHDREDYTSVLAGSFDQPTGLAMAEHIFCDDKADFYEITDGLPQYARGSPGIVVADG
ncbi:hypothetical protein DFR52_1011146 [Hoeflea marina]|uniref:CENP-V/GFA domain-containing protein n=1 Tax=Hoeflea marina TaxID=274592 RepID=A0A317PSJ5_9HYPH|nr:GFA family protein [Hoeflea marina]PWW04448.1 hypothetical protein DFR52_1011146 [Hoeflea marina]